MASPADVGEVVAVCPDLSIPEQQVTAEGGEDIDYVAIPKASCQWASILLYLGKAGYDIKLVDSDGFTWAMSQVTLQKKDTSVTFWAERIFLCHTYDISMTIIVTKPGIIIDVVGSYFYDKKS